MDLAQKLKLEKILGEKVFSVSEFLDFINEILTPLKVTVEGEVGGKMNKRPNWMIFNLLDKDGSILKCFCWNAVIENLGISLEEGAKIRVFGFPEIRKEYGEIRFQVQRIELLGEGALKQQFEFLKKKLTLQGYFDQRFKKPIPPFSQNIGLITSKYGRGALKDFIAHLEPFNFKIYFYDVRVEGINAIPEIVEAINAFNQNFPKMNVLVLTRGGGDWESLKAFNSKEIVKAIFSSKIPVITGIGHEDDETLADLAADLRASTPTHAAKLLSENWKSAKKRVKDIEKSLPLSLENLFGGIKARIDFLKEGFTLRMEKEFIKQKRVDYFLERLNLTFNKCFEEFNFLERQFKEKFLKIKEKLKKEKEILLEYQDALIKGKGNWQRNIQRLLKENETKLKLSSPLFKLKQGFSITFDEGGKVIKNAEKLKLSQIIKTKFYKGRTISKIKEIKKK